MIVETAQRTSEPGTAREGKTLIVLSHLQHCIHVWSPHHQEDMEKPEKAVRRIKRMPVSV